MEKDTKYKHRNFVDINTSPLIVAPKIMNWFAPKKVVDVGCGLGAWLNAFQQLGVKEILGLDGVHLDRKMLLIPEQNVLEHDLETPFHYPEKFDIVISLEVAEHLSDKNAATYIKTLVDLGDVILFSAAIPNQWGQNHINEQWVEYWQEKFAKYNYQFYDVLRPIFWNEQKIRWYYRQNMFLIIKDGVDHPFEKNKPILNLIHPDLFTQRMEKINLFRGEIGLRKISILWLRVLANKIGLVKFYRSLRRIQ